MQPREKYESGTFPHCLWMNSIIQRQGEWMMYYGAGDVPATEMSGLPRRP